MKTLTLALFVMMCCCSIALAQDRTPIEEASTSADIFNVYYSDVGYKITIESKGGAVSVLEVPEGVMLNLEGQMTQNPSLRKGADLPRTFRGDLVIRTRRADEVGVNESNLSSSIRHYNFDGYARSVVRTSYCVRVPQNTQYEVRTTAALPIIFMVSEY